jgi:hypothetical protein
MAWYQIIHAISDSYVADRDAEELLHRFSAAFGDADVPGEVAVFYGHTPAGARRYYFSLSPEAFALVHRVLAAYEATELAAPPNLTGMQKIRRLSGTPRPEES